jgi:hypothetical protein
MKKALVLLFAGLIIVIASATGGCSSPENSSEQEEFAIYLTRDDVPISEMEKLSHVEIADEPVVSIEDIVTYDRETHEITLTAAACERVMSLKVPTSGKSFLVCLDKSPVYWGAFWAPYSSQSFDGVTILVPAFSEHKNTIKLELGYPAPSFYSGEDPRSNAAILRSLEKAGKLK